MSIRETQNTIYRSDFDISNPLTIRLCLSLSKPSLSLRGLKPSFGSAPTHAPLPFPAGDLNFLFFSFFIPFFIWTRFLCLYAHSGRVYSLHSCLPVGNLPNKYLVIKYYLEILKKCF